MMDILHISQSTENRNLSMNFKVLTTYLKFYTKRPVHFINHVNVKQVPMFFTGGKEYFSLAKFNLL